ncbi:type IV pilus assembly protein PilC [Nakamurella panacisegetis]|uniref:Type IV pilus assembly protein PilC n=1 Tax=Nakamurella panacisegetis TaxID=1090615 RepID=A0A1H0R7B1_9ACTN|nr:type II secretion system F family protein [Nakamurella panacisegetis]SDP25374.1 type IV pilus assembly protein PilC [Nakamurella panacisegetis]
MARFAYVATDPVGGTVQGIQKADSREAAEIALFEKQFREIRVTEQTSFLQRDITEPKIKREEVMHLSRQLAAFIRAGLPLLDSISTLGEDAGNKSVKKMMATIEEFLRRGETLSDCVDRYPKVFPDYYRGILRSAELTGQLDTVLDQLASYLERDLEARRKIKSASIYPGIILLMSLGTVVVLAAFVLPRFKVFFASLDARLPLPTRMLLAVTDFFGSWWWAILIGLGAVLAGFLLALQTDGGRHLWNKITLSLPVIGDAVQFALVERFCRLMSSMIGAGVNLSEALSVSSASLRNLVYNRALAAVGEQMLEGQGLAKPLADTKLFPSTAAQMIRVGEETGSLDVQLEVAARYYERELDYKIKRVTALFEPAVIIAMGLVVGFVALALVSAMYGVFNQVKT